MSSSDSVNLWHPPPAWVTKQPLGPSGSVRGDRHAQSVLLLATSIDGILRVLFCGIAVTANNSAAGCDFYFLLSLMSRTSISDAATMTPILFVFLSPWPPVDMEER